MPTDPDPPIPLSPSPLPNDEHIWDADLDGILAVFAADPCPDPKKIICCTKALYGAEYAVSLAKHLLSLKEAHDKKRDNFMRKWRKEQHDYLAAVAAELGI